MDDMYKNQIDYAEIPADAVILDVRNGSEHTEIALRRKHYFVELPQFDAKSFIKDYGLNGEKICVLCKSGFRASKAARMLEEAGYPNVAIIKGGISSLIGKADWCTKNGDVDGKASPHSSRGSRLIGERFGDVNKCVVCAFAGVCRVRINVRWHFKHLRDGVTVGKASVE